MAGLDGRLIVVVGGSGFVGRYLVQELAHAGARVRVVVRSPERAGFLKPLGGLGQIEIVAGDVARAGTIAGAFAHADAGVNLVGILDERSGRIAFLFKQPDLGFQLVNRARGQNGVRPGGGHFLSDCKTDAARGAGDEGGFSRQ